MRKTAIAFLALGLLVASTAFASNVVRISQVYGGGGASTTPVTYKQDYVELFNNSGAPVNIGGWYLAYASSVGNYGSTQQIPANTTIPACGYLFIACGTVGTAGSDFPITPDLTYTSPNMSATDGKISLISVGPVGTGTCPGGTVVDHVSYGASTACEGTPTAKLSKTTGAVRKSAGAQDTDNNVNDFNIVTAPVPRNTASARNPSCAVAVGACCLPPLPTGGCIIVSAAQCGILGGTYIGNGTLCTPDPCPATPTNGTTWGQIKTIYR